MSDQDETRKNLIEQVARGILFAKKVKASSSPVLKACMPQNFDKENPEHLANLARRLDEFHAKSGMRPEDTLAITETMIEFVRESAEQKLADEEKKLADEA